MRKFVQIGRSSHLWSCDSYFTALRFKTFYVFRNWWSTKILFCNFSKCFWLQLQQKMSKPKFEPFCCRFVTLDLSAILIVRRKSPVVCEFNSEFWNHKYPILLEISGSKNGVVGSLTKCIWRSNFLSIYWNDFIIIRL